MIYVSKATTTNAAADNPAAPAIASRFFTRCFNGVNRSRSIAAGASGSAATVTASIGRMNPYARNTTSGRVSVPVGACSNIDTA